MNAAILILAASVFHKNGYHEVAELEDAYHLLGETLGTDLAPKLFAVALILAGQSSTVTGTLAGQIVMEGYLHLRINPMLRRILTRLLAVVPAVLVILFSGESKVGSLLIFSQVILSMQLAFAVIPLIHFVSDKSKMGNFAINKTTKFFAWTIALVISFLNAQLVFDEFNNWMNEGDSIILNIVLITTGILLFVLLLLTFFYPIIGKNKNDVKKEQIHQPLKMFSVDKVSHQAFNKIVVALDFSMTDEKVLNYVTQLGNKDSKIILVHVVESPATKYMGEKTDDSESKSDLKCLEEYAEMLKPLYENIYIELGYNNRVEAIAEICNNQEADLLIVGSHGHNIFKDIIFGETVNKLRHKVKIPVFIAK